MEAGQSGQALESLMEAGQSGQALESSTLAGLMGLGRTEQTGCSEPGLVRKRPALGPGRWAHLQRERDASGSRRNRRRR